MMPRIWAMNGDERSVGRSGWEGKIGSSVLDTGSEMFIKHSSGRGMGWRYKFGKHKLEVAFKARMQ